MRRVRRWGNGQNEGVTLSKVRRRRVEQRELEERHTPHVSLPKYNQQNEGVPTQKGEGGVVQVINLTLSYKCRCLNNQTKEIFRVFGVGTSGSQEGQRCHASRFAT